MTPARADGRQGFCKRRSIPRRDMFFPRKRQLTYQVAENVTSVRLSAQKKGYLLTLRTVPTDVDKTYPGMLSGPRKISI